MLNLNPTTLAAVVEKAAHDAANHPRWLTAIGRAIVELDSNPWIERGDLHGLIIASPSGNLYTANGTCQCPAHTYGNACWHRAAARLVRLHDEREAAADEPADQTNYAAMRQFSGALNMSDMESDHIQAPLGQRLAHARAQMDELFA